MSVIFESSIGFGQLQLQKAGRGNRIVQSQWEISKHVPLFWTSQVADMKVIWTMTLA